MANATGYKNITPAGVLGFEQVITWFKNITGKARFTLSCSHTITITSHPESLFVSQKYFINVGDSKSDRLTSTSSATPGTGVNLDIAITGASEGTGDNSVTVANGYPSASITITLTEYYIIKLILNLLYSSSQAWRA